MKKFAFGLGVLSLALLFAIPAFAEPGFHSLGACFEQDRQVCSEVSVADGADPALGNSDTMKTQCTQDEHVYSATCDTAGAIGACRIVSGVAPNVTAIKSFFLKGNDSFSDVESLKSWCAQAHGEFSPN